MSTDLVGTKVEAKRAVAELPGGLAPDVADLRLEWGAETPPDTAFSFAARAGRSRTDGAALHQLAKDAKPSLRTLLAMRTKYDLDVQDLFVLTALGIMNFDGATQALTLVQPISISSMSDFLTMPKETVRRRLSNLESKALIARTGYGFVVKDIKAWGQLASTLR